MGVSETDRKNIDLQQEKKDAYHRFRLDPPENNEDGTEKFVLHSKLMSKLNNVKLKEPDVYSEDELVNSFRDNFSSVSESEEEDEESKKKLKRKKKKVPKRPVL